MQIAGIICEYNPLHLGHSKQISLLKEQGYSVVCLMSGNFVQRGEPAVFSKMLRARAALECGADAVLELPVTYALRSAEGFAQGGVQILSPLCDILSFGAESGRSRQLLTLAEALLSPAFREALPAFLAQGLSFPAARQQALASLGLDAAALEQPNNILAVEYCKAILSQGSPMKPVPIHRGGDYHASTPDAADPSATSLRLALEKGQDISPYLPPAASQIFTAAQRHTLAQGEKAMLAILRTLPPEAFAQMPFGSEGLWRKFMQACRQENTLEDILRATKSKRYAYTRIARMAMCATLGISEATLRTNVPHVRILGFRETGRAILRQGLQRGLPLVNAGTRLKNDYYELECRCSDLYGLFASTPQAPGQENALRPILL